MSGESGFREKKLFFCTDLAVVEASKVVNKLLTETVFLLSFLSKIVRERRGPFSRGLLV